MLVFRILSLYAHDFTEYTENPTQVHILSEIFGVICISEFRISKHLDG